ncbi:hypothetical protein [Paenibacillus medicaginis]|uniref:SGNH hydrolase-type esterase domain-containing protein n=1 Tax=Paenibacillus medicaginis TaxID=1470560 RepID=A0ABV5C9A2_9BACL
MDNDTSQEAYPKIDRNFTRLNQEIAGIKGSMVIASYYGLNASVGDNDATALLNDLFAEAKIQGKKYVYFDVPHTYHVSGPLTNARDLILLGDGASIKSSNLNNYYIQICNTLQVYTGKYNTMVHDEDMFAIVWRAIQNTKVVNVCIWGDSISTGSEDNIGINYNTGPRVGEGSPHGLTAGDAYVHRLIDMLVTKFKDVTFNFYNRAIGGSMIQQWQDAKTFSTVTKPWIDHIQDTNADLFITAWGMNNETISSAKEFIYYMDQITNHIHANFTKQPSMVWLTTPRPVMALEDSRFGTYDAQFARDLAAYAARMHGKSKGHYIIDVNKVSNLKRAGKDFEHPIMRELAVTNTQVDGLLSGNYTKTGTDYMLATIGQYLQFNVQLKDFVLEFEVRFGLNLPAGNESLWLAYNLIGDIADQGSVILFYPKEPSGVGAIGDYSRYLDHAHWGRQGLYTDSVFWDDNTFKRIRVEKRGDILDIFLNRIRVMRTRTKLNNFNHPATVGIEEVYEVALREFVDDLADIHIGIPGPAGPTVTENYLNVVSQGHAVPSGAAVPLGAHTAANGTAITHVFGSPQIVLEANQTYQATYSGTVRVANGGAIIAFKLNGVRIGFTSSFSSLTNGTNLSFSNTVIFSTTGESILTVNNMNAVDQTFVTLNVSVVKLA